MLRLARAFSNVRSCRDFVAIVQTSRRLQKTFKAAISKLHLIHNNLKLQADPLRLTTISNCKWTPSNSQQSQAA
eukprot:400252-Amphidinium_carterae.1